MAAIGEEADIAEALGKSLTEEVSNLKKELKTKEKLAKDMGFSSTNAMKRSLTTYLG